jgi:hypothetical protein
VGSGEEIYLGIIPPYIVERKELMNNIPKYILNALEQRRKHANEFVKYDSVISNFCEKYSINTQYTNLHAGCIGEPDVAKRMTLEDIESQLK